MPRPPKPEADPAFLERLEECASRCGSRASLARRAGLTPGSIQNYFDGGEPSRRTLVDLAKAANVTVQWLAAGEGEKELGAPPMGYELISVIDLAATANHLRGILDQFGRSRGADPFGRLVMSGDLRDLPGLPDTSPELYIVENSGLKFEPEVRATDVFMFSVPHGFNVARPSDVRSWIFLKEERTYLVAMGTELRLRKLHRHKDAVDVIGENGKQETTLSGRPHDFILFGPIVWRAGSLPPGK
jgi:hypothetical protein